MRLPRVLGALWCCALWCGCQSETVTYASPATRLGRLTADELNPVLGIDTDPDDAVFAIDLIAAPATHSVDGASFEGYAYNGAFPGPTLVVDQGDTVRVNFNNATGWPSTIHWHGLNVPFEMDGVPWMIGPVADGDSYLYEFAANDAGTFWYHPHFNTAHQVDRGLYGALIVRDPTEPVADAELVLVFDGVGEFVGNESLPGDEAHHSHHQQATVPRWIVNGHSNPTVTLQGGSWARVRIINVSNAGYLDLRLPEILLLATDQGRLPSLRTVDSLVLGPGDRAELIVRVGTEGFDMETAPYTLNGGSALEGAAPPWSARQTVLTIAVDEPAPMPPIPEFDWSDEAPTPDPGHTDIVYVLSGSPYSGEWFINGEQFPDVTIETVPLGSVQILEVRNLSPTHHPFHMHGHHFEVLSVNGVAPAYRRVEDTIDLAVQDRVRLRMVADNPGDWMTHCHILSHPGGGMMTILRVE